MKKVLILIFILISAASYSQKINKALKDINKDIEAGNYQIALTKALKINSALIEEDNIFFDGYSDLQQKMAEIYLAMGNKQAADSMFLKTIECFSSDYYENDPRYSYCLTEYTNFLIENTRFKDAGQVLQDALANISSVESDSCSAYASVLSTLGNVYYWDGHYSQAEEMLEKSVNIFSTKSRWERGSFDAAFANHNLTSVYLDEEKYDKAISLGIKSLAIDKKLSGEKSEDYVEGLIMLGNVYIKVSRFNDAYSVLTKALETEKSLDGTKSEKYAEILDHLGELSWESGDFDKSEKLYLEALKIQESGKLDANDTYFGMAALYQLKGDFSSAESMIFKVLKSEYTTATDSSGYMHDLNLLANNYTLTGNYKKAGALYKKIADYSKKKSGENTTDYAVDIDNIANLYIITGKDSLALPYIQKALEIKKANKGPESPEVAYSLDHLAAIRSRMKDFAQAEKYEKETIEIYRKSTGEQSMDYAEAVSGLGSIYLDQKKYALAESTYRSIMGLLATRYGTGHPLYVNITKYLADICELTGRKDSAETLTIKYNESLLTDIRKNFAYMAENEKEAYISSINEDFGGINAFIFRQRNRDPQITRNAYDNQLALKGIVLQSSRALRQAIENSGDTGLIALYSKFTDTKKLLQIQQQLPLGQRWLNTDSLDQRSEIQEKDLNLKMEKVSGANSLAGIDKELIWKDVRDALGDSEAAVEFVSFDSSFADTDHEAVIYCALILRSGMNTPEMIPLFDEAKLEALLKRDKYSDDGTFADRLYTRPSPGEENKLFSLIWKPIEKYLEGIERVYFSPTGLLNKIAFDALPYNNEKYLSDRYRLNRLLSTREIVSKYPEYLKSNGDSKCVFYGGIDYDTDTATLKLLNKRFAAGRSRGSSYIPEESRGGSFMYLEGTLNEVDKIAAIMDEHKLSKVLYKGREATEESFKALNNLNSPQCIHIATHGFFFPEVSAAGQANVFRKSDNPLFRSGLIFAGGNNTWRNQPVPRGIEDGILLASEVSEMYLPNTKLVVLSACETGLGEVKGTEGVFGLQRAFKMAGVEFLIISLWQVPDYQTSELMDKFYENWSSGNTIHDSFSQAQNFMKSKYSGSPSSWAAFTLVE
jgi:CHAT domain-containing protein/Tfp pilus assembly protein PilF